MDYRALFFKIRTVGHLHRKNIEDILNEVDLFYGQHPILIALERKGPSSQKEIAEELHVSAPSITNSVKRLTKKGFITCDVKEEDRRSRILCLTDKGLEVSNHCKSLFDTMDKETCSNIDANDLIIFEKVLDTMINNLKKEKGENND